MQVDASLSLSHSRGTLPHRMKYYQKTTTSARTHHDNGIPFINQHRDSDEMDLINDETITVKEEKNLDSKAAATTTITTTSATMATEAITKNELHDGTSNKNDIVDNEPVIDETVEVPCSVETKPYYSINAKLVQREKKQMNSMTTQLNKQNDKNIIGDNRSIDDINIINEQQNYTLDNNFDCKLSTMIDSKFRVLNSNTSNAGKSGNNSACNKTSVTCLVCGKQLSNQYNLRVHMETHSNSSYSCSACSHVSRSRDALRKHVSYRHPVATPQKRSRYSLTKP